jgi:hypothetical protein
MKFFKHTGLFGFLMMLNYSCTFYYKTSDIDSNLKKSVSQINVNCSTVQTKIGIVQKDFVSLKCNSTDPTIQKATNYLQAIETSMKELNQIKAGVNSEYDNFLRYSKGKNQIQSKTEEWKKFKQTKKILKSAAKDFKKKGNELNKIATDFSEFKEKELSTIQYIDVVSFDKEIDETNQDLSKLEKDLLAKLKVQETQIGEIISRKQASHPDKCKILSDDLVKISEEKNKVTTIRRQFSETSANFKKATIGFLRIYSCSEDWDIIQKMQEKMISYQSELQLVDLKLHLIHDQIQELITSMN